MLTAIVDVLEAAVCAQPAMVIVLVTAAPASGIVTSVPFVPVHEAPPVEVAVAVAVAVAVVVEVDPPPSAIVTVTVLLVQEAAYEVRAVLSALSTLSPHRVFTAVHSVT
jgi:hypothetical protein